MDYLTIPRSTFQRYLSIGLLFRICNEKTNLSIACSFKGILKKQLFKSIIIIGHNVGKKEGKEHIVVKDILDDLLY